MFYEFYIDQFAAEHLLSGYLLLLTAVKLLGKPISRCRILAGSAASVLLMIFLICRGIPGWYFFGMITAGLIVFKEKNLKNTAGNLLLLLFLTLCFGGILDAVTELMGLPLAAGTALTGLLIQGIAEYRKKKEFADTLYSVRLEWKTCSCTVQALLDTGNCLREPLTGKPVSILAETEAEKLLGKGWELQKGFYLVPYRSLGTEKSWMRAVTADRMLVEQNNRIITVTAPVIALYRGTIGKQYQMILHREHAS